MTFGPKRASATAPATASPTVAYEEVVPGPTGLTFRLHLAGVTSAAGVVARTPLIGAHNASNAAAAAAVALALDVGEGSILDGLATVQPAKHRAQLLQVGSFTVLDDCYNAAPNSMRAALDALVEVTPAGAQKIAVLGDMLELGPQGADLHAGLAEPVLAQAIDLVFCCGPLMKALWEALPPERRGGYAETSAALEPQVLAAVSPGDALMIKGSLGSRMGRIVKALQEHFSRHAAREQASAQG
jgi:UDP-N-acetylmuramoyl-tripeptide--D-alanyl-D-alanine ligase